MAAGTEVRVPDIGDFKNVEVIEVLVKPGDAVSKEQSLITLESDKATMEIPSPGAGGGGGGRGVRARGPRVCAARPPRRWEGAPEPKTPPPGRGGGARARGRRP